VNLCEAPDLDADTEFIVAARNQLPPILDALDAVLALHKPVLEDGKPVGCICCDWDVKGNEVWPCATVAAITKAPEGKQ
jgi:hypothetical protein